MKVKQVLVASLSVSMAQKRDGEVEITWNGEAKSNLKRWFIIHVFSQAMSMGDDDKKCMWLVIAVQLPSNAIRFPD